MRKTILAMTAAALLALPAAAPRAQACANADNVDLHETCLSTPADECDGSTTEVVVQLGGIGSVNNNGVSPGQLDDGTKASGADGTGVHIPGFVSGTGGSNGAAVTKTQPETQN